MSDVSNESSYISDISSRSSSINNIKKASSLNSVNGLSYIKEAILLAFSRFAKTLGFGNTVLYSVLKLKAAADEMETVDGADGKSDGVKLYEGDDDTMKGMLVDWNLQKGCIKCCLYEDLDILYQRKTAAFLSKYIKKGEKLIEKAIKKYGNAINTREWRTACRDYIAAAHYYFADVEREVESLKTEKVEDQENNFFKKDKEAIFFSRIDAAAKIIFPPSLELAPVSPESKPISPKSTLSDDIDYDGIAEMFADPKDDIMPDIASKVKE